MFRKLKKFYFKIYHLLKLISIFIFVFLFRSSFTYADSLPSDYVLVPYLSSTGTQYIDTGINANNNIAIEVKLYNPPITKVDGVLYGGGDGWLNNYIQGEYDIDATFGFANKFWVLRNITATQDNYYTLLQDRNKIYSNGTLKNTISSNAVFSTNYPIYLYTFNRGGTTGEFGSYNIVYCKIWDNDTLVRDFVPVYKYSTDSYGLYDFISDTFFYNLGTGLFSTDPEFVIPSPPSPSNDNPLSSFITIFLDRFSYLTSGITDNAYIFSFFVIIISFVVLTLFLKIYHSSFRRSYK